MRGPPVGIIPIVESLAPPGTGEIGTIRYSRCEGFFTIGTLVSLAKNSTCQDLCDVCTHLCHAHDLNEINKVAHTTHVKYILDVLLDRAYGDNFELIHVRAVLVQLLDGFGKVRRRPFGLATLDELLAGKVA